MLVFFFFAEEYLNQKNKNKLNNYVILFFVLVAVSLINPFFIEGLLAPFTIFKEYGYMISENQSVLFMQKKFDVPLYIIYETELIILLILLLITIFQNKIKSYLFLFLPLLAFGFLGFMAVRCIPLFALISIPSGAFLIENILRYFDERKKKIILNVLVVLSLVIIVAGVQNGYSTNKENNKKGARYIEPFYFSPIKYTTGIGLLPDINKAADFFITNNVKGPVFNDYDIGGYLIYHLYGREKVFVDNRPEAYSVDFFQNTYIPMQQDFDIFRQQEQKYHFNCIWFYLHEDSPWANNFLLHLIEQPDYAPVFSDGLTVIFLKRNGQNAKIIQKFEIDKSLFGTTPRNS